MDFYGTARSNAFRVKDPQAFAEWAATFGLQFSTEKADDGQLFHIIFGSDDDGCFPQWRIDLDTDQESDDSVDLPAELAPHLQDGEIAILMSAGAEGQRYVSGYATAVHSNGRTTSLVLADIYKQAANEFSVPIASIRAASYDGMESCAPNVPATAPVSPEMP